MRRSGALQRPAGICGPASTSSPFPSPAMPRAHGGAAHEFEPRLRPLAPGSVRFRACPSGRIQSVVSARVARPGGLLYLTTPNYLNLMGLYELYALVRHPGGPSGLVQPLDRRYVFFQTRRVLRKAGWKILRTDGTVYQVPLLPRHNPVEFPWLESNRTVRKLLSPFAFHYFVMAQKPSAHP